MQRSYPIRHPRPEVEEADHKGTNRVIRGGSWNYKARNCRAAYRNGNDPSNRNDNLGFRLARAQAVHRRDAPDPVCFLSDAAALANIKELTAC